MVEYNLLEAASQRSRTDGQRICPEQFWPKPDEMCDWRNQNSRKFRGNERNSGNVIKLSIINLRKIVLRNKLRW
jgi:hypothetical protein